MNVPTIEHPTDRPNFTVVTLDGGGNRELWLGQVDRASERVGSNHREAHEPAERQPQGPVEQEGV